ncbi:MAG: transaldolase / glucose-6-phosphate isomerase [Blastocatellia bacterium]|jgi:glucose-6-phosphate isomerase|nr:transaldolase / glucose-6-phosphate isomerase [Blastocatellia bacterium]
MNAMPEQSESLGDSHTVLSDALERAEREHFVRRIWAKDASLWKSTGSDKKIINNSLGWLTVPHYTAERIDEMETFVGEVRAAGFTHLMLLGMGGSSLCPEVFRRTFGQTEGFPELLVLDTTDPDTISNFESRIDLATTLFIVSSKSGSTIEPLSFYKYFYDRVRSIKGDQAGENFIAITDPGTLMERTAREANFRRIFLNPADIGGRYSALSYFGTVPAALMGCDVREMLQRTLRAVDGSGAAAAAETNAALRLGCALGALAVQGRDKLTLMTSSQISSLGLWIEQLVAESTGKEGKGIVPIAGEPLGQPDLYGSDRVFVAISVGELGSDDSDRLKALEAAGHPVIRRVLNDPLDLGAEFFVWEFATAVAGALLEINPFDQPNVQESKDNTNSLLEEFKKNGKLPEQELLADDQGLRIFGTQPRGSSASEIIKQHLSAVRPGDYVALLAYMQETSAHEELLQSIRTGLRDRLRVATTTGYGPRFLHSTGQLHKGGPDSGVFIQLTCDAQTDLAIPREPYTFATLRQAQALGDFSSLAKHGRRAIRVHLGSDVDAGLKKLLEKV